MNFVQRETINMQERRSQHVSVANDRYLFVGMARGDFAQSRENTILHGNHSLATGNRSRAAVAIPFVPTWIARQLGESFSRPLSEIDLIQERLNLCARSLVLRDRFRGHPSSALRARVNGRQG